MAAGCQNTPPAAVSAQLDDNAMTVQCSTPTGDKYILSNTTGSWRGKINNRPAALRLVMTTGNWIFEDYEDCIGRLYSEQSPVPVAVINFSGGFPGAEGGYEGKSGVQCIVSRTLAERGLCNGRIVAPALAQ
jgi:hypothetical protein